MDDTMIYAIAIIGGLVVLAKPLSDIGNDVSYVTGNIAGATDIINPSKWGSLSDIFKKVSNFTTWGISGEIDKLW